MCMRIYEHELSWYEAHNFCSKSGYSLALIDSFELDKQLNRVVFNASSDLVLTSLFNTHSTTTTTTTTASSTTQPLIKRFWTGIRHLNESHWFDFKNEPIVFGTDEANWWPWLVVDPASYSQGSCVAKRHGALFLDDCYKRMPFACQLAIAASSSDQSTEATSLVNAPANDSQPVKVEMIVASAAVAAAAAAVDSALMMSTATAMVAAVSGDMPTSGEDNQARHDGVLFVKPLGSTSNSTDSS